jgi:hypothetical protein
MNINFFNAFHNGDIHYSRTFVSNTIKDISKIYPDTNFVYYHQNPKECILDIEKLQYVPLNEMGQHLSNRVVLDELGSWRWPQGISRIRFFVDGENIYINTWVGCWKNPNLNEERYIGDNASCTITANELLYRDIYEDLSNHFGIKLKLPTTNECIPRIDYSYYHIEDIDKHIEETKDKFRKRIFISNGDVFSQQSPNFSFDPIMIDVVEKFKDCAFYFTNPTELPSNQNTFKTQEIIDNNACDLNENSYLSTKCDIIIGRASGPHAFAGVYDNFMDENKIIYSITKSKSEGIWFTEGNHQYEWTDPGLGWSRQNHITTWDSNRTRIDLEDRIKTKIIELCEK